jgi:hypothetical protein
MDLAVNDKTFAYLSVEGEPFSISCKLPRSAGTALMLPFTKPTGYGLGKSGWVSAELAPGESPPVDLFEAWIDESYRAQAPKKLVSQLPPAGPGRSLSGPARAVAAGTKRPPKAGPAARARSSRSR